MKIPPLLILALAAIASPAAAQQAERLVDHWIAAAGGRGSWDHVHTLEYTITTVWYDSAGAEVRRRPRHVRIEKLPSGFRLRVERNEAAGRYVQVWDGRRAWATLNGERLADSTLAVRETPYVGGELFYWMGLPWKLRDPGVRLAAVEPNAISVTFGEGVGLHDGDRYWYYWGDARSPFPTETHYIEQGHSEVDRKRIQWSDWTRIGPARYAAKRQLVEPDGRPIRAFLITDVRVNRRIPASVFAPPS